MGPAVYEDVPAFGDFPGRVSVDLGDWQACALASGAPLLLLYYYFILINFNNYI